MNGSLLEFKKVTKEFTVGGVMSIVRKKTIKAVDSVSFTIPLDKPVITALVGESGSGKTTITKLVLGFLQPTSGEIYYRNKVLSRWLKEDKMKFLKEVQPIFQDPYSVYNPFYRVDHALEIVIKKFNLASSKAEARELMVDAMKNIGLRPEDLLGRYPHQLSGGERQRFMLARILLLKPKLIVADEPISMIDVSLRAMFLDHLLSFKDKFGISCLYVTHDLNTASYVSDTTLVLCHGRIVEEGPTQSLMEDPLHPYTKLLVNSMALPDPERRWKDELDITSIESFEDLKREEGCTFSARCPYAKDVCRLKIPCIIDLKSGRKVACFLYQ